MRGRGMPETAGPRPLEPLASDLRSGKVSLRDYIIAAMDRVDSTDRTIMALLPEPGRRSRLLAEAAALEARFPDPLRRPPLYGVLLGVKDLFAADGFETRAGSKLPSSLFEMDEGPVIRALKKAGVLILGKTVSTEFAYFSPGPTRNPWNPAHTPGGSSSGSAAAVAAGYCPLALGTQTIGSITRPAAFCGIAGWKPSFGRTASEGVVPFSPSLDHVGLFASDAASLASAVPIMTSDWRPSEFSDSKPRPVLAIPDGPYLQQAEPQALDLFTTQVKFLEAAGFILTHLPSFPDIAEINDRHRRIAAAELQRVHTSWFKSYRGLYSGTTAEFIEKGAAISDSQLEREKAGMLVLRGQLQEALDAAGADFWLSPAATGPAPIGIDATGSPIMNLPWTHAGVPTLTVPAGFSTNGMPIGLQIAARFGGDESLLALGIELENTLEP